MSGKKDFDISQYLNNGVVSLENLNIADSTIAALQMEDVHWKMWYLKTIVGEAL